MNIAFDAKRAFNNKSGLGNYSRDVIRAIIKRDADKIFLFTPKLNNTIFSNTGSAKIVLPQTTFEKKFKSFWRSISVSKIINNSNIDIYHGLSNELPFSLNKNVKTVVTIHDLIFKRFPQWYKPFDRKMYDWKFKSACKKADRIIAISEQTKSDIINYYNINESKISVVYQTCNDSFKCQVTSKLISQVKEKYNLPNEFLLNVGTIEPRKNALDIVKALHTNKINTPLFIIGRDTKYAQKIKKYIAENKLDNQITILHNVTNEELPIFYKMAKIFIYPSTFEGFGIPIIEALYSGTPVITSQGGCFSEPGGKHSIYVEVGNITELANAISNLLQNKAKQQEMIEQGLKHVQIFNTDKLTEDLYKVYSKL